MADHRLEAHHPVEPMEAREGHMVCLVNQQDTIDLLILEVQGELLAGLVQLQPFP